MKIIGIVITTWQKNSVISSRIVDDKHGSFLRWIKKWWVTLISINVIDLSIFTLRHFPGLLQCNLLKLTKMWLDVSHKAIWNILKFNTTCNIRFDKFQSYLGLDTSTGTGYKILGHMALEHVEKKGGKIEPFHRWRAVLKKTREHVSAGLFTSWRPERDISSWLLKKSCLCAFYFPW